MIVDGVRNGPRRGQQARERAGPQAEWVVGQKAGGQGGRARGSQK